MDYSLPNKMYRQCMYKTITSICQLINSFLYISSPFSVTSASVDRSDEEKSGDILWKEQMLC